MYSDLALCHYLCSESLRRGLMACPTASLGQLFCRLRPTKVTVALADHRQSLLELIPGQAVVGQAQLVPVCEGYGVGPPTSGSARGVRGVD